MAESITFNNATYIIPDVGESNWGQNLTNYFVAIPQGCYQASGGTLALTRDLSFGSSFGIAVGYLFTTVAIKSTTGLIRMGVSDTLGWRNNANNANLLLAVDGSDNLLWNGDIIATSSTSPVLSITGTAHQVIASAATGNITLSTPQNIDTTSTPTFASETLTATTNQLVLGTTHTTTISSTAPSASRTYTIPDAGGAANVVLDAGNYTIAGTWTFSNAVTITPTTNQLVLGTTRTITISATQPASSSRTYTIPDQGAAANFVLDQANYTIAGTWSFSNSITLASSKAVILTDNSTHTVTLKATNATTSYTFSLPTTAGTNTYFLQTDGSGNTSWQPGGSGTVQSGTAGNLTLYPATAASVSDTYVQNAHNITLGIATQGSRSANLAITIPNPGNAVTTANVVLDQGAYTIAGALTLSATLTMSGATIAMGANKITGLANGTASTDAAAFGQIPTPNVVTHKAASDDSATGNTFANTTFTVTITPSSSSAKILLIASGTGYSATNSTPCYTITNTTSSTQLGGTNGLVLINTFTALNNDDFIVAMHAVDSPASASAQTYYVQVKNLTGGSNAAHFGDGYGYLTAMEIH